MLDRVLVPALPLFESSKKSQIIAPFAGVRQGPLQGVDRRLHVIFFDLQTSQDHRQAGLTRIELQSFLQSANRLVLAFAFYQQSNQCLGRCSMLRIK